MNKIKHLKINICNNKIKIYESCTFLSLQAERQSQHRFEKELQERERRLKQQEEAFVKMYGLRETLETWIPAFEKVRTRIGLQTQKCVTVLRFISFSICLVSRKNFASLHWQHTFKVS